MRRLVLCAACLFPSALCGVENATAADVPGDKRTKAIIKLGQSKAGLIEFMNDQDWYRTTLKQGNSYGFAVVSGNSTRRSVVVYDVMGRQKRFGAGSTTWRADASGTFFVAAGVPGAAKASYNLSLKLVDVSPDPSTTEGKLETGKPSRKHLYGGDAPDESSDHDSYAVNLQAGLRYKISGRVKYDANARESGFNEVSLQGPGQSGNISLFNPDTDTRLSERFSFTESVSVVITEVIPKTGVYYLTFQDESGVTPDVVYGEYEILIAPS